MALKIISRIGRRKGKKGITIQLIDHKSNVSKSITTHGLPLADLFPRIKLFLSALEKTKGKLTITVENGE